MDRITLPRSKSGLPVDGFTLIEVLVAIVILMVGLLGMLQAINLAMDKTLENQLRQEAVAVAEKTISNQKALPFANITASNGVGAEQIPIGGGFKNLSVAHMVTTPAASDPKTKQISVRVWWRYRGRNYEHQTSSAVGSGEL